MKKTWLNIGALIVLATLTLALSGKPRCSMCSKTINPRTNGRVELVDKVNPTCCVHCTLMLAMRLNKIGQKVTGAYVRDFDSGAEVLDRLAYYVLNSKIVPCCVPSIISFADKTDAQQFQRDHGGEVLDYNGIMAGMKKHKGSSKK